MPFIEDLVPRAIYGLLKFFLTVVFAEITSEMNSAGDKLLLPT